MSNKKENKESEQKDPTISRHNTNRPGADGELGTKRSVMS